MKHNVCTSLDSQNNANQQISFDQISLCGFGKEWFSVKELGGAPGLPSSYRGRAKKLSKNNIEKRCREGKGGGYEYHISGLPQETKIYLAKQQILTEQNQQSSEFSALVKELEEEDAIPKKGRKQKPSRKPLTQEQAEAVWLEYDKAPESLKTVAEYRKKSCGFIIRWT